MSKTANRFSQLELAGTQTLATTTLKPAVQETENVRVITTDSTEILINENGEWRTSASQKVLKAHKHVAKDWEKHCIPFNEFYKQVKEEQTHKKDLQVHESYFKLEPGLTYNGMTFTENGLKDAASYAGFSNGWTELMHQRSSDVQFPHHDLYQDTTVELMNLGFSDRVKEMQQKRATPGKGRRPTSEFLIRTRPDFHKNQVIRAICSEHYEAINNDEALEMIKKSLEEKSLDHCLSSHLFNDGDNMTGTIFFPDYLQGKENTDYGVGLFFKNSEVGDYTLDFKPFIFSYACANGIILGKKIKFVIKQKHIGNINHADLFKQVKSAINLTLNEGQGIITQLTYSKDFKIQKDLAPNLIAYLSDKNRLNQKTAQSWYQGYLLDANHNAKAIVDGLTRAAQWVDGNDRVKLETVAGDILTPSLTATKTDVMNHWSRFYRNAQELKEEEVQYVMVRA